MLNRITIMGRLTRDPELRKTPSGKSVASFTVACERDYKDDSGNRATDFIDCVAWNSTADFVSSHFTKGMQCVATGRLQIRTWTDKNDSKRLAPEIMIDGIYFGERKAAGSSTASESNATNFELLEDADEMLPF